MDNACHSSCEASAARLVLGPAAAGNNVKPSAVAQGREIYKRSPGARPAVSGLGACVCALVVWQRAGAQVVHDRPETRPAPHACTAAAGASEKSFCCVTRLTRRSRLLEISVGVEIRTPPTEKLVNGRVKLRLNTVQLLSRAYFHSEARVLQSITNGRC